MKIIEMYTDGSCLGNPGPGGWSVLLKWMREGNVAHEKVLAGNEAKSTNNRMELMAVIAGLEALKQSCIVTVHTDSQYVVGILNGNKARANADLVARLRSAAQPHVVRAVKVAGHSGDADNERVDGEARRQAQSAA